MGAYVNPQDMTKESWLLAIGAQASIAEVVDQFDTRFANNELAVILINNGPFTAAGICFSKREAKEFTDPKDSRPKTAFWVPLSALHSVSPELKSYLDH